MEVRIGITQVPRELDVDLGDKADADDVVRTIEDAIAGDKALLWLTDRKGRRVGVPSAKIAYVEVLSAGEGHRVGFGVSSVAVSK